MSATAAGVSWIELSAQTEPTKKTSAYRGVSWRTASGMWLAQISIGKKKFDLGFYVNEEDAAAAYVKVAAAKIGRTIQMYTQMEADKNVTKDKAVTADKKQAARKRLAALQLVPVVVDVADVVADVKRDAAAFEKKRKAAEREADPLVSDAPSRPKKKQNLGKAELMEMLTAQGLDASGLKSELVKRLKVAVEADAVVAEAAREQQ